MTGSVHHLRPRAPLPAAAASVPSEEQSLLAAVYEAGLAEGERRLRERLGIPAQPEAASAAATARETRKRALAVIPGGRQ